MKSLRARLKKIERHFEQVSAAQQLRLCSEAIDGDPAAASAIEGLHAAGRVLLPFIWNLYAIWKSGPVVAKTEKQRDETLKTTDKMGRNS